MSAVRARPYVPARLVGSAVALVAAVGAAGVALLVARGRTVDAFIAGMAVLALPGLVWIATRVPPAMTIAVATVLSVFAGNWSYANVPFPPERVLFAAGLGVAAYLVWVKRTRTAPPIRAVHYVLLATVLYAVLSALWVGTLTVHAPLFALTDRLGILPYLLFFAAPTIFASPRERNMFLIALVVAGAYLGVTANAEGVGANALVFPKFILNVSLGSHAGRARGPFLEAAANGLGLFYCAVACGVAFSLWTSRAARTAAAVIGLMCLSGIIFTLTRQVWIGGVVGIVIVLIATRELRRFLIPTVAVGAIAVVALLALVPGLRTKANERAREKTPVWDRLNSDRAGLRMFEDRPLLGFGWGSYSREAGPYYTLAPDYPLTTVNQIHSVFLSNAVELGIVGGGLWAIGLVMGIGGALTRRGPPTREALAWRTGLIAAVVCWLVVANFTPLDYAFDNEVLWLWAGIAWTAAVSPGAMTSARREPAPVPA
jgi:O-antigen ligase